MEPKHIKDLTPDPRNARKHTPRNVGMIEAALGEVGAARSIVIDEAGVVLAGNATIEAAAAAGIERVQVVDADGETIIAVRRRGLTEEQKAKLALYDNRASELAEWDAGVLAGLAEELDLDRLFFPHEIAKLLEQAGTEIIDTAELWKGMPEFEYSPKAFKSIAVHFANEGDYEAFARLINQTLTAQTRYIWYPYREKDDLKDLRYEREG